jgi:phage terminase large subunit GpA-like protein
MSSPLAVIFRSAREILKPPPKLDLSQWADEKRYLSPEDSAEVGRWQTSLTPYLKPIMDAITNPAIREVTFCASAQSGKTQGILNNGVGYHIDQDPAPMLIIMPTKELGESWSKDRLDPMLRDTPCLRNKVHEAKSRDSKNTILHKGFKGGHLTVVGSNSPIGLTGRPVRVVWLDELDKYAASAGGAGDPEALAAKRTKAFWNSKIVRTSTPLDKLTSRILPAYEASNMAKWYVPCPQCGEFQVLKWGGKDKPYGVKWPKGKPEEAFYVCEKNGCIIVEEERMYMVGKGEARDEKPLTDHYGLWVWEIYSPFTTMGDIAKDFEKARKNPETLKQFINETLAEGWEEEKETFAPETLVDRTEKYKSEVPAGVGILAAGADVHPDRAEFEVVGFGEHGETWGIEYGVIYGDFSDPNLREQLDDILLSKKYKHELGVEIGVTTAFIDSGFSAQDVYSYTKPRERYRIYACKGDSNTGKSKPIVNFRPSKNNSIQAKVFYVGTITAKDYIYARLKIDRPGSGYMHFPIRPGYDLEYFKQLTAEEVKPRTLRNGQKIREYHLPSGRRNEALDCRVYAIAAFINLRANMIKIMEKLKEAAALAAQDPEAPAIEHKLPEPKPVNRKKPVTTRKRRGGFATNF